MRYIVLELTLSIYRGLTSPLQWLESLAIGGTQLITGGYFGLGRFNVEVAGTQTIGSIMIDVGYWILFIALGWPLFKDVNAILGIDLKDYTPAKLIRSIRRPK